MHASGQPTPATSPAPTRHAGARLAVPPHLQSLPLWQQVQRRSMFIQTETTPNPESLKYIPGEVVLDEKYGTGMVRGWRDAGVSQVAAVSRLVVHTPPRPQYFRQGDKEVGRSPLAKKLLKIPGVEGVFLGRNFITITKASDVIWQVSPPSDTQ